MINSYYNEGEEEKRRGASNLNGFMAGTRWWRCCVIIIWQPCAPCVTEYRMMNDPLSRPGPAWWIFRPPKGWRTDQQLLERRRPLQFSPPPLILPSQQHVHKWWWWWWPCCWRAPNFQWRQRRPPSWPAREGQKYPVSYRLVYLSSTARLIRERKRVHSAERGVVVDDRPTRMTRKKRRTADLFDQRKK